MAPARSGRGGQGGHEPRSRILARAARVLALAAAGRRQTEIAADLGISQAAVSKILARELDREVHAYRSARERERESLRLKVQHIHREGLDAWHRSQEEITRRRQRKVVLANGEPGVTVVELESETRHGDSRCLATALKALQQLHALVGPSVGAMPVDDASRRHADLSDGALEALIARQARLLADADARNPEASAPDTDHAAEHTRAAVAEEPDPHDPSS